MNFSMPFLEENDLSKYFSNTECQYRLLSLCNDVSIILY